MKDTDKQTIFEILAHPIRRRILEEVHNRGEVSYSIFTEQMAIPTGTLYHHLRYMKDLIEQGDNKQYRLTPKGVYAIELVQSSEINFASDLTHPQIPSLTVFDSLFRSFVKNPVRSFTEGAIIVLVFLVFTASIGAVVFGPFLLSGSGLKFYEVILIGLGSWLLCAGVLELITQQVYKRRENSLALATACALMFIPSGSLGVFLFFLTRLEFMASISSNTLLLIEIGTQILSVFVLAAAITRLKFLSRERAALIALIVNYLLLVIVFVLMNANIIG
jgi:DNA-binding transcriptional ArsR family regulator